MNSLVYRAEEARRDPLRRKWTAGFRHRCCQEQDSGCSQAFSCIGSCPAENRYGRDGSGRADPEFHECSAARSVRSGCRIPWNSHPPSRRCLPERAVPPGRIVRWIRMQQTQIPGRVSGSARDAVSSAETIQCNVGSDGIPRHAVEVPRRHWRKPSHSAYGARGPSGVLPIPGLLLVHASSSHGHRFHPLRGVNRPETRSGAPEPGGGFLGSVPRAGASREACS